MEQRPLHWSERAKMYPSPPGSGQRRPSGVGKAPGSGGPGRKRAAGGSARKGFWAAVVVILCAAAAAAVVFFWYLPNRDNSADSDSAARVLVLEAQNTIERAYLDTETFDPTVMDRTVLSTLSPAISFNPSIDDSAATGPLAQAADASVNYYGTETTYAVGTVSKSGTTFGLIVDKRADTTSYYTNGQPVESWTNEAGPTTTAAPVTTTQATGPISSAADIAAQMLLRNAMTALESGYAQFGTFAPDVLTPAVLAGLEPAITFVAAAAETAATVPASLASNNTVDLYATASSFALGTVSASGNTFGVRVTKGAGGSITTYYVNGGVENWAEGSASAPGQFVSTPATAPAVMARHEEPALGCSFDYPASWVDYPPQALGVPTAGFSSVYAVYDPAGGKVGDTPGNYILFAGVTQQGGTGTSPKAQLDSLVASMTSTFLAGAALIEPVTDFEVNNMLAAATTYRLAATSPQTVCRIASLIADGRIFQFFFVSAETRWSENRLVFEATLDSFQRYVVA